MNDGTKSHRDLDRVIVGPQARVVTVQQAGGDGGAGGGGHPAGHPAGRARDFLDPAAAAYTVPFMPPSVRVIGASGNLVHPGASGLLQRRIEAAIRTHPGPLWGMEDPGGYPGMADATLAYYRLRRAAACAPVETNIEPPRLMACPLERAR